MRDMELGTAELQVDFAAPTPALRPFITSFYQITIGDDPIDDHALPEWFNLRLPLTGEWWASYPGKDLFALPGPLVQGPSTFLTHFGGRSGICFGVGMLPLGWARLFGTEAETIANRTDSLTAHMDHADCGALMSALSDADDFEKRAAAAVRFFTARLESRAAQPEHSRIDAIFRALGDPAIGKVDQMAEVTGIAQPSLMRNSKRWLGFGPKLLLRRQRFMRMMGAMHIRPYQEWKDFLDPFYTDQSHMIRDFQEFLGMSPTRYFALPRPILRVVGKARANIIGQPMQLLHDSDLLLAN